MDLRWEDGVGATGLLFGVGQGAVHPQKILQDPQTFRAAGTFQSILDASEIRKKH